MSAGRKEPALPPCILFLLDWTPQVWSTREEYFRQMSHLLSARGIVPVLTVAEPVDDIVRSRFEQAGARLFVCPYGQGYFRYWRHLRRIQSSYAVLLVQIRFFDYFVLLHWMGRLCGMPNIVFTEANSGEWSASTWKASLVRLRTRLTCFPLARAIAISDFIRKRLIGVGIPERKTTVIYNGVDTGSFSPDPSQRARLQAEFQAAPDTLLIAFASALLEWKRPQIAIGTCHSLIRRGLPVKFLLAGTGPLQTGLEQLSRDLGVQGHVHFLNHYPHPHRLFQGCDLFLHTSLGEAFGNVLAEAMACGVPVVATDSGGTPEVVADGETGYLVPPGDTEVERLADAIEKLAHDPDLRRRMGDAGIQRARRLFSVEQAVENTFSLYEELLRA